MDGHETVLSKRRAEVKDVRNGLILMSCSLSTSGPCPECLVLNTRSSLMWSQEWLPAEPHLLRGWHERSWWTQTEWGQCPPSFHSICFLPFCLPSFPGSWGMCAVQDFWGDKRPWSWHWCLVAGHPEFLFWELPFFFFKSGTWGQEAYLEGGDKEERDEGWELTSRIIPMLFPLPLPCPGLINTRRLIFGCGVRAGLQLSPGALLNVINCGRAVRGVCEWHLSLRPSSNIYTVEVQPRSLLEKVSDLLHMMSILIIVSGLQWRRLWDPSAGSLCLGKIHRLPTRVFYSAPCLLSLRSTVRNKVSSCWE